VVIEQQGVKARPILRWAGSKRLAAAKIASLVGDCPNHYIEPFAGSACVFFAAGPKSAVLSDLNQDVVNLYNCIKYNWRDVVDTYRLPSDSSESYYKIRSKFNLMPYDAERAGYFLYLNRLSFNGIYRVNRLGHYNVPFGGKNTSNPIGEEQFEKLGEALVNTIVVHSDFESAVKDNLTVKSVVYLDPPFFTSSKRVFNEYTKTQFSTDDLSRFKKLLDHIDYIGAKFVASYADVPEIQDICEKWACERLSVVRNVAGFKERRASASEVLFSNLA
jgi:DNA adenine methylase